ncbi:MAG: DUF402 domain-containing protein [Egibacteraceae bacterium]
MRVHSTKFDGSLHYRYDVELVAWWPGVLALYRAAGTPLDSYRGTSAARVHTLELHWADRWHNLAVSWDRHWRPREHYVNVATPSVWDSDSGIVRFVDLDLDVIWDAASDAILLDDVEEFDEHQVSYGYPPDLVDRAWEAVRDVHDLFRGAVPPFDGRLYAWRPGAELTTF